MDGATIAIPNDPTNGGRSLLLLEKVGIIKLKEGVGEKATVPTKDAMFIEDSTSPYVNIIAVREGDENRPEIQALIKVLHSDEIKQFITEKYKGAVVPAF